MVHGWLQLLEDQIVPCGNHQRGVLSPFAVNISDDIIRNAIVDASNHSFCGGCMQVKAKMPWWIGGEVDVVPETNVAKSMECLQALCGYSPIHSWTGHDVHVASLWCIIVIHLNADWSPSPHKVVKVHNLDHKVPVLSIFALVDLPLVIYFASFTI